MPIARSTIKTGPATVKYDGAIFHFKSGLTLSEEIETFDVDVDTFGTVDVRIKDRKVMVKGTPAGEWEGLSVLWAGLGYRIGQRVHGDTDKALVVHFLDGDKYTFHNAAITKMPGLKFHTIETLIKDVEWTARVKDNTDPASANSIFTRATGVAWADGVNDISFASANIKTLPYSVAWGAAPFDSFSTQDGIDIEFGWSLKDIEVDGSGVVDSMVEKFNFTAKFKPIGLLDTDIDARVKMQGTGASRGASLNATASDLIITASGVYVTLRGAAATMRGIDVGMSAIRTGELSLVATRTFTAGVANALAYVGTAAP